MMFTSMQLRGNDRLADVVLNAPVMKKGEVGRAVRIVQQALIDLGYAMPKSIATYGTPDGIYGKETKAKVRQFQEDEKLGLDGKVGTQTLSRIDALLAERKIPSKTLPDLPPGAPGDSTDSVANTILVMRDVLALLNPLTVLGRISLEMTQTTTEEGKELEDPVTHRVSISGSRYQTIAELIDDGTIPVMIVPTMTHAGLYVPHALSPAQLVAAGLTSVTVPPNSFVLSRPMTFAKDDRFLIIHEATHAVCDLAALGETNALLSELLAFVAEAIYSRKRFSGAKMGHRAYEKADLIAEKLLKGEDPDPKEVEDLAANVRSNPEYRDFTHGSVQYWGLDK